MFAVVFGLSMDYEVFLVSRVREQWVKRRDASSAVADGIASTGRVISAAAAIMVCVFLSFMFGDERTLKEFGFGLAVAVLLDALVVRCVLLPAVLELLGKYTWWLPRRLDTALPDLDIEASMTISAFQIGVSEEVLDRPPRPAGAHQVPRRRQTPSSGPQGPTPGTCASSLRTGRTGSTGAAPSGRSTPIRTTLRTSPADACISCTCARR